MKNSEAKIWPHVPIKVDEQENLDTLKHLFLRSPIPYAPGIVNGRALCPFDLHTLMSYVHDNRISVVTELGCGITTYILRMLGLRVNAFSLDISHSGRLTRVLSEDDYVKCDVFDEDFREQILVSCKVSDCILIDCLHSYNMAEYYSEKFLTLTSCPVILHDMENPLGNDKITGEQAFIHKEVLGTLRQLYLWTGLSAEAKTEISQFLDCEDGEGMGRSCLYILEN